MLTACLSRVYSLACMGLVLASCVELDVRHTDISPAALVATAISPDNTTGFQFDESAVGEFGCEHGRCSTTKTGSNENQSSLDAELGRNSVFLQMSRAGMRKSAALRLQETLDAWQGQIVPLTVELSELDFDFGLLARSTERERTALLDHRQEALIEAQDRFLNELSKEIVSVRGRGTLTNVLDIDILVQDYPTLATHPQFFEATLIEEGGDVDLFADGLIRAGHIRALDATVSGSSGGKGGGAVRVGVLECNGVGQALNDAHLNEGHEGFRPPTGSAGTRVLKNQVCAPFLLIFRICRDVSPTTSTSHSTMVAAVAAGSVLNGQAPSLPGTMTLEQRRRSGMAYGADIAGYICDRQASGPNLRVAIESAVRDNMDIINISYSWRVNCDLQYDQGGVASAISAAVAAGTLVVASAGNQGSTSHSCTVGWPGSMRNVVAVGGLDTYDPGPWNQPDDYGSAGIAKDSSKGGTNVMQYSGGRPWERLVSIVAPYHTSFVYTDGVSGYGSISGTSFAAPQISSLGALGKSHLAEIGHPLVHDADVLRAYVLLMGDGRSGPESMATNYVSDEFGYGGARYFEFSSNYLGDFWQGYLNKHYLTGYASMQLDVNGGLPLPSNVRGFKFVLYSTDSTWDELPEVFVSVYDMCDGQPEGRLISTSPSSAGINALRLRASELAGACVRVRINTGVVRPGGVAFGLGYIVFTSPSKNHLVF